MTTTVRIAAAKRVPTDSMRKTALVAGPGSARRRGIRPYFEASRHGIEAPAAAMPCPDAPTPPCSEGSRGTHATSVHASPAVISSNHAAATPQANRYRELT